MSTNEIEMNAWAAGWPALKMMIASVRVPRAATRGCIRISVNGNAYKADYGCQATGGALAPSGATQRAADFSAAKDAASTAVPFSDCCTAGL